MYIFKKRPLRFLFGQLMEKLGYFLFQHLVTLSTYLSRYVGRQVDNEETKKLHSKLKFISELTLKTR